MIVDTFLFYNELDLLEIRLEELKGVVDHFVLVEARQTLSGKPKPLYFQENAEAFAQYSIEHVIIDRFPDEVVTSWQREHYSRWFIAVRLRQMDLASQDLVLLSDLDEIPRAEAVARCVRSLPREVPGTVYVFRQHLSYYYANCQIDEPWYGTRMARWGDLSDMQVLRETGGVTVSNGGWHFSYMGGSERVREKVGAYAHTEFDQPQFVNEEHVQRCLEEGVDLFGRNQRFQFVPLDVSFPRYLIDHKARFDYLIRDVEAVRDEAAARALYDQAAGIPSDIFEHVPYLYRLASMVDHITEMGTRNGHSTSAFLYAKPGKLIAYDIERSPRVSLLEEAAVASGVDFTFHQQDVLTADIEPTDLLFIDTWHVEEQIRQELARHADKARLYLVLHDTESFAHVGETAGHGGIWPAVREFIRAHPEWSLLQHFSNNNGLTVFTRVGSSGQ